LISLLFGLAAALVILIVLIVAVVSYIVAWRVTRPGHHTYWDEYSFRPSDMDVPYETVTFTSPDGLQLSGWLMVQDRPAPAIVMGSGYRDRKGSMLPVATGLWKRGLSVLLFDFRNQGDSAMDSAQTMGWREIPDMLAAEHIIQERLPGSRIGAMGWSMGAVVSIFAAARDRRISAVVSDCAYADQNSVLSYNFRLVTHLPAMPFIPLAEAIIERQAGYRPSRVRTEDVMGQIAPRPVLLIHAEKDDLCPLENVKRLYARAGEPKELWIVPEVKHVGAYFLDPDAYLDRVAAFFHAHLD
jgi:fermentation-respiration switch protein FrsA (DUF1100 family)